jgi:Tol biopolymer transport system component
MPRRLCTALLLALASGCATQRQYVLSTTPHDAAIRVNGDERARGFLKFSLAYSSPQQTYSVVLARDGFEDLVLPLNINSPEGTMNVALKPKTRTITINVEPADANLFMDGKPISEGQVTSLRHEFPFQLDESLRPVNHTLRAERKGYAPVEAPLGFGDPRTQMTLTLGKLQKDLSINTTPSGAQITLDGVDAGTSPVAMKAIPFNYDPASESFVPRTIVATRPGYPATAVDIAWDNGKSEYNIAIKKYQKTVRIESVPADAKVMLDGKELKPDAAGVRTAALDFTPLDDAGTLPQYTVESTVTHENEIWKPLTTKIGWDEGQPQYTLTLEEILTRKVSARAVEYRASDGKWSPVVVEATTTAWKDLTDGPLGNAERVTDLPQGTNLAQFSISPDGKLIVYALVEPDSQGKPKTRLYLRRTDGIGGATSLTDGRSIDLTPTFSPDGNAILFSSDRGGGKLQVWSIPIDGQSGATRLTAGDADHLFGSLDSSPKPRVFYQALVPGQDVPKLYSNIVGTVFETDLVQTGGFQPRLNPRNDALAFVQFNNTTRKTDIVRTSDKGGVTQKLTDSPDVSERDPAWSPDGTRLALTAEVPFSSGEGIQTDIYITEANGHGLHGATMNDSLDDLPAWTPTGDAIYFRSNRGGKWDIWKIAVK